MSSLLSVPSVVTSTHQARLAYVYVRQSSPGQVTRHGESTDLQYRLVERAVTLGWPRDRVQIIDEDLGRSGASAEQRTGFQRHCQLEDAPGGQPGTKAGHGQEGCAAQAKAGTPVTARQVAKRSARVSR